jgi:hypothetical protein
MWFMNNIQLLRVFLDWMLKLIATQYYVIQFLQIQDVINQYKMSVQ